MLEEIKKGLLASFGTIFLTKDKIEEVTKKMVEQAKISKEDAQKLADELIRTGEDRWTEVEKTVSDITRKGLDSLDVCHQSELQELSTKIDQLEKRLAAIEAAQKSEVD
jgi:polyhydroxyalkanoate synthesis regulator phasin